jgi:UDP-N-acetylmuramate--alanine ligase
MPEQSIFSAPGAHVHIIGIGGAGMSAIAHVLLDSGVKVSGSDRQSNDLTRALQRDGATIYEGHEAGHAAGASVVLVSSAVKDDNPEVVAARAAGIPILDRKNSLPHLLPGKTQIAVAGTHGKTTTTALIVHLLRETGHDPSYIVGGTLLNTGDNAHAGKGDAFVVEADEYGEMFLGLRPKIAVVTNIEHDHPDQFPTLEDVIGAFRRFVALLPDDGTLIACADDQHAITLAHERKAAGKPVLTYGLDNPDADWSTMNVERTDPGKTVFVVQCFRQNVRVRTRVTSTLPGRHNVLNTLAALAAVHAFGVALDAAIPAVSTFKGTGRRFEVIGQAGGVTVVSDYGHHPTAIRVNLQAMRQRYSEAKIWAVWQPHTYSRTRLLASDFAHSFGDADHALVTEIYAAREQPQPGDPTGDMLARMIGAAGHPDARHSGDLDSTAALLRREVRPGDVVIIFSAGDAPKIGEMLLASLAHDPATPLDNTRDD